MKIQFLNGGLANQSFQYIFAKYYELSHPGEIMYMDDSYFSIHTVHNGYELEKVFGIKPHMLSECFDETVWKFILDERKKGKSIPQIFCENQISIQMLSEVPSYSDFNPFDGEVHLIPCNQYFPDIMNLPGSFYYHGYWINKNWFEKYKNIFLEEFSFPEVKDIRNLTYLNEIETSNSVSIHVRRKDYVTLNWAWNFDQYQSLTSAFTHNRSGNYHLFVFSDDIEWCKEHSTELGFYNFHEITYIEGNTDGQNYIDMQLMSSCKAMIISNSSFCYLAALLNTKKNYVLNATSREII